MAAMASPAFVAPRSSGRPVAATGHAVAPGRVPAAQAAGPGATAPATVAAGLMGLAGRRRARKCLRKASVVAEVGANAGERPKEGKGLKVIVAGGGVGGLTTAFAMLKQGWDAPWPSIQGSFNVFSQPCRMAWQE